MKDKLEDRRHDVRDRRCAADALCAKHDGAADAGERLTMQPAILSTFVTSQDFARVLGSVWFAVAQAGHDVFRTHHVRLRRVHIKCANTLAEARLVSCA